MLLGFLTCSRSDHAVTLLDASNALITCF